MKAWALAALAALLGLQPGAALEPGNSATCTGPIKKILLIRRKPDTSPAQFRDYYENHHVPLALKLLGPFMLDYRRNYAQPADPTATGAARGTMDDDVVTEIWFRDRAAMEAMYALVRRPLEPVS